MTSPTVTRPTTMAGTEDRPSTLDVRWLGRVHYRDAHALQHALCVSRVRDHLLCMEHPHVYTLGVRADDRHVLVAPASVGAELVRSDRGGDVTYHGPGQLVAYPILTIPPKGGTSGGKADTVAYIRSVEQVVIDTLARVGLPGAGRLHGYPGVWIDVGSSNPRKIAAIGVRLSRGRSMHGLALNVDPDMEMFTHIVPCGIPDKAVTSLAAEGIDATMREVVDACVESAVAQWGYPSVERSDAVWRVGRDDFAAFTRGADPGADGTSVRIQRRLDEAGVDTATSVTLSQRKPEWLRARVHTTESFRSTRRTVDDLGLVTVCEEAGCPNIYECWDDGTATFMVAGERCTRACGFCLVDTRHPEPLDAGEPARVADAVERMDLAHAVVTMVARDDLPDGAAAHVAATVSAIRGRRGDCTAIEVLISDLAGSTGALDTVLASAPDVLNHNVETVLRLQRAVRPSASYARSLGVLSRSVKAGFTTKSGLIVGMGETDGEVRQTLVDLAAVGVEIITIGQYLRPTAHHLPVARWVRLEQFDVYREWGTELGIGHVEADPLTRSSHHARQALAAARR